MLDALASTSADDCSAALNSTSRKDLAMLDALAPTSADDLSAHNGQTTDYEFTPRNRTLARVAEDILRETFATRGHRPSDAHWRSLREVLETIQAMADGVAPPRIHLAGLSPGLGKTSCVVAAMIAMREVGIYRDTGTIVCVGRVKEAFDLATSLAAAGLGRSTAILLSEGEVRELRAKLVENAVEGVEAITGNASDPAGASLTQARPILITSQQRVYKTTQHRAFRDVAAFRYQNRPREVVIWDESIRLADDWLIPARSLHDLVTAAFETDVALGSALEAFMAALRDAEHDTLVDVPDWTGRFGITATELNDALVDRGASERAKSLEVATALFAVGGRSVRVFHDRKPETQGGGNTVVSFTEALPQDLNPLVLDASVLVRPFYDNLVEHRGAVRLTSAQQRYNGLTCHLWRRGGGKRSFKQHGPEIIQGIVQTILTEARRSPTDRWLVVHHKAKKIGFKKHDGFAQEVLKELPDHVRSLVSFITYGSHCGVNDYQDCQRVVLAGTLFLPEPSVAAMTHASKNRPLDRHAFESAEELRRIRDGQTRDCILQAGLRGCARHADGETCRPMDLYLIGSASSGVPSQVPEIFPGCRVVDWSPLPTPLRGKALAASVVISTWLVEGRFDGNRPVTTGHLAEALRIRPDQLTRDVSSKPAWSAFLASQDLCEVPGTSVRGKAARVIQRVDDAEISDDG